MRPYENITPRLRRQLTTEAAMLIFRVTQKLASKLKSTKEDHKNVTP